MNRKNIAILTSIRFFAALAVVIAHYEKNQLIFPLNLTNLGGPAVTFFFLLSGFVLTYAHVVKNGAALQINIDAKDFLIQRLARILPAYVIGLVLAFPILFYGYFQLKTISGLSFWSSMILTPTFMQSWFPPAAFAWNPPSWSLSVEWLFYIIFPYIIQKLIKFEKWKLLSINFLVILILTSLKKYIVVQSGDLIGDSIYWYNFLHYFPPRLCQLLCWVYRWHCFHFKQK